MKLIQYLLIITSISLSGLSMQAQVTDVFGNKIPAKKKVVAPLPDNYNQTDSNGLKQGPWEKRYTDGTTLYKATFRDNKPVGEYTRYHPNGKMSIRIIYDEQGEKGDAEMFDDEGHLASAGKFIGKSKEGLWTYYNNKKVKASTIEFENNKQHGKSTIYYPNGTIAETYLWQNGIKQGTWNKFFRSGATMLKAEYKNGLLEGKYLYYFENGKLEIDANYKADKEDGKWTFYHADGKVNYILKYKNGTLLNPEVLEERQAKQKAEFEKNKGQLKDPEKMQNNPDAYIRR